MGEHQLTDDEIRAQIADARGRAQRAQLDEPHAASVRYDATTRRVVVGLTNGAEFSVPVARVPELRTADAEALAAVEVGPAGIGLHWPALDADVSVAGLARLVFGARTLAQAAGAQAGSARTAAKTEAARANGARGGRPRRAVAHTGPAPQPQDVGVPDTRPAKGRDEPRSDVRRG